MHQQADDTRENTEALSGQHLAAGSREHDSTAAPALEHMLLRYDAVSCAGMPYIEACVRRLSVALHNLLVMRCGLFLVMDDLFAFDQTIIARAVLAAHRWDTLIPKTL